MSTANSAAGSPIDREHLRRATLGDGALERELLAMFQSQIAEARVRLAEAQADERGRIAHAVKGAARGLGAFEIADCAAEIERRPHEDRLIGHFGVLADRIDADIRSLSDV